MTRSKHTITGQTRCLFNNLYNVLQRTGQGANPLEYNIVEVFSG